MEPDEADEHWLEAGGHWLEASGHWHLEAVGGRCSQSSGCGREELTVLD